VSEPSIFDVSDRRMSEVFKVMVEKGLPKYGRIEVVCNDKHVDVSRTDKHRINVK